MSRRGRLDLAALEGLGEPFQEPIARLAPAAGPGAAARSPEAPAADPASDAAATPDAVPPPAGAAPAAKAGRAGRQQAGYIPAALNKELMLLAIRHDRKKEDLVEEAVRELLHKYGVPLPPA